MTSARKTVVSAERVRRVVWGLVVAVVRVFEKRDEGVRVVIMRRALLRKVEGRMVMFGVYVL